MARRSLALALAFVSLCTGAAFAQTPAPIVPMPVVLSQHVIVVSIDGLRADAIEAAGARTLAELLASGSGTTEAQTILPSRTLPSHTSMLTGVLPETHGITWNSDRTEEMGIVSVPTVFELAHDAGYHTAAFFSKKKLRQLVREGSLDMARSPGFGALPASRTVPEAVRYLRHEKPNLLFVHIAEPDFLGHTLGWMSLPYRWAVREADAAVRELLKAATETYGEGNFTFIVTADHGGHGNDHGSEDLLDTTIPWISWGRGIRPAHRIVGPVSTVDTAATILQVMGLAVPAGWDGVPIAEALAVTAVVTAVPGAAGQGGGP